MLRKISVCLMIVSFYYVQAISDEDVKLEFIKHAMQCLSKHPVNMPELIDMQLLKPPKSMEAKCLLACAYKSEGAMDANGKYNQQHVQDKGKIVAEGDEKRLANIMKLDEMCVKVNEAKDDEKGCERAALIFKCVTEIGPKYKECQSIEIGNSSAAFGGSADFLSLVKLRRICNSWASRYKYIRIVRRLFAQ